MEFTRGEVVEWIVEDKNRLLLRRRRVSSAALKKNETQQGVMAGWNALFDQARAAFAQHRSFERARMRHLRQAIHQFADGASRSLLVCTDATLTNRTMLRHLPPRTTRLGRILKDACL